MNAELVRELFERTTLAALELVLLIKPNELEAFLESGPASPTQSISWKANGSSRQAKVQLRSLTVLHLFEGDDHCPLDCILKLR
jgi:hypothetical protein